jgi:hypothetical protein
MILAAFLISSAAVLVILALIAGAQNAAREKGRDTLQQEVAGFLDQAAASDADHASGVFDGMKVEIALDHHEIGYTVELPPAVLRYSELLERFGTDELRHELFDLGLSVEPAAGSNPKVKDRLVGSVPREPGLSENLVTIANRLDVARRVRALRNHAPSALLDRLVDAHSSYDIDQILLQLAHHFPDAPETEDAIELAAEREHGHPDRVRARAQQWLAKASA